MIYYVLCCYGEGNSLIVMDILKIKSFYKERLTWLPTSLLAIYMVCPLISRVKVLQERCRQYTVPAIINVVYLMSIDRAIVTASVVYLLATK